MIPDAVPPVLRLGWQHDAACLCVTCRKAAYLAALAKVAACTRIYLDRRGDPSAAPHEVSRATRVSSSGSGRGGGGPERSTLTGAYRGASMWPGITEGNDARCSCSWAWRGETSRMEIKRLSGQCLVSEHRMAPEAGEGQ